MLHCRHAGNDECWWGDWHCAAIAHHSFLWHAAHDSLHAYDYGVWDFSYSDYERWYMLWVVSAPVHAICKLLSSVLHRRAWSSSVILVMRVADTGGSSRSGGSSRFLWPSL